VRLSTFQVLNQVLKGIVTTVPFINISLLGTPDIPSISLLLDREVRHHPFTFIIQEGV
jgi:hypothetical protein